MQRHLFLTALLLLGLLVGACSSSAPATPASGSFPNTPEGVVRKMLDSIEKNDANQYLDSVTPEDRKEPGFFFYKQLAQGLMSVIGLGSIDAAKPKVAFRELQFETTQITETAAQVSVVGKMRELNVAMEQDFRSSILVVKQNGTWLCSVSKSEVLPTPESRPPSAVGNSSAVPDKPTSGSGAATTPSAAKGGEDRQSFDSEVFAMQASSAIGLVRGVRVTGTEKVEGGVMTIDGIDSNFGLDYHEVKTLPDGKRWERTQTKDGVCVTAPGSVATCAAGQYYLDRLDWHSILTGQTYDPTDEILDSGFRLDAVSGRQCAMYYLTISEANAAGRFVSTEICYDLATALPIQWVRTRQDNRSGEAKTTSIVTHAYSEFDTLLPISRFSAGDIGSEEERNSREMIASVLRGIKSGRSTVQYSYEGFEANQTPLQSDEVEWVGQERQRNVQRLIDGKTQVRVRVNTRRCIVSDGVQGCSDVTPPFSSPMDYLLEMIGIAPGAKGIEDESQYINALWSGSTVEQLEGKSVRVYYRGGIDSTPYSWPIILVFEEAYFDVESGRPLQRTYTAQSYGPQGQKRERQLDVSFRDLNADVTIELPE